MDDLKVWRKSGFEYRLAEHCSIGNHTCQEDNDDEVLVNLKLSELVAHHSGKGLTICTKPGAISSFGALLIAVCRKLFA